jgi:hypothetical protein
MTPKVGERVPEPSHILRFQVPFCLEKNYHMERPGYNIDNMLAAVNLSLCQGVP